MSHCLFSKFTKNLVKSVATACIAAGMVFGQSGTAGPLNWSISNGTLTISGAGDMPNYSYNNYAPWHYYRIDDITKVEIGESVTSIGNYAFLANPLLTAITIPNSVTRIGEWAFLGCRGLTSIVIGNSVAEIGKYAFYDCEELTTIDVEKDNNNYVSVDGALFNKAKTTLIRYPTKKTGAYTIPNSVTSIGVGAFQGCNGLTSVVIGESVTSIDDMAFSDCSGLTAITIPNSVTSIGNWAFYGCDRLTSITIPNSVTEIGERAFGSSGLTSVEIPNSVTSIRRDTFSHCSGLTLVVIPNSVTSIEKDVFWNCSGLTSVEIPNSVTSIEEGTFYGCSGLTSVVIPNSVTSIGNWAFENCSGLTSVEIPNSVTSIGGSVFKNCSELTSVVIPNSVTSISWAAFSDCSGLTSVVIGESIASIEGYAFSNCSGLTQIVFQSTTPPSINSNVFNGVNTSSIKFYVPEQSLSAYQAADVWKDFDIQAMDDGTPISKAAAKKSVSLISFAGIRNGEINLNLKAGNYTAELYNLSGRLVSRVNIIAVNGVNATGLKTNNLSKGMFILNVKQAGASVLKQKVRI